jgi:peptidoglycan/LPS O-acetylase OafA/YrhL
MLLTKAQKKNMRRTAVILATYLAALVAAFRYVQHQHPKGAMLYVCAAVPALALIASFGSLALYLRQEWDSYSREFSTRPILWGAGAAMSVSLFIDFLRMFGWKGQAPPFLLICLFSAVSVAATFYYEIVNRDKSTREKRCGGGQA